MLVFVYGTLKRSERNHSLLRDAEYLGEATTVNNYLLYDLGPYPCMVEMPQNGKNIKGEVWKVDEDVMSRLDALEGVDCGLYKRISIKLTEPQKELVWSYIYLRDVSDMEEVGEVWTGRKVQAC